jgi:hypothetical protein
MLPTGVLATGTHVEKEGIVISYVRSNRGTEAQAKFYSLTLLPLNDAREGRPLFPVFRCGGLSLASSEKPV